MEALQVIFIFGLPSLILIGVAIWALKRETRGMIRGVGYSLMALGLISGIFTVAVLLNGPLSVTSGSVFGG